MKKNLVKYRGVIVTVILFLLIVLTSVKNFLDFQMDKKNRDPNTFGGKIVHIEQNNIEIQNRRGETHKFLIRDDAKIKEGRQEIKITDLFVGEFVFVRITPPENNSQNNPLQEQIVKEINIINR